MKKIADALRAAGVEVWFDQSELVGGDAWDAKIRGQISRCALFMPVISTSTQARLEGYFRVEWKLAAQRTHAMADEKAFLVPVVLDATKDAAAKVPAEFKAVQWTRLPGGEASPAFVGRVKKLLSDESGESTEAGRPRPAEQGEGTGSPTGARAKWWWALPIFGVAMALMLVLKEKKPDTPSASGTITATAALSPAKQLAERARALRSFTGATRERLGAAEDLLEQALKLDASEAEAWAVGAEVDVLMVFRGWDKSDARRQSAAKRVSRALALAPGGFESRQAQAVLDAFLVRTKESYAEAETIYRTLLQEQPASPDVLEGFGTFLMSVARYDEAAALFQRAGRTVLVGEAYGIARRSDEALRIADDLLAEKRTAEALVLKANVELFGFNDRVAAQAAVNQLTPTELREDEAAAIALRLAVLSRDAPGILKLLDAYPRPFISIGVDYPRQYWTGIARAVQQQPEAAEIEWRGALRSIDERVQAKPDDPFMLGWAAMVQAHLGDKDGAEKTLRLYRNYINLDAGEWDWIYCLTNIQLGIRKDEMIDRLEKTLRSTSSKFNSILYAWARFSPEFDSVRDNLRFEKLLRDVLPKGAKPFDDPRPAPVAVAAPAEKSVAVLAFADLSEKHDSEYFSDGVSEELLNVLAKVPELKVSARTSAFSFKGREVPVPEIAKQLGVAYIVDGSVRKQGDKVRITAQLIKAADGFQVWSDTFTRDLKDIFAVQDEIAGLIAKSLSLKLGTDSITASVNPQAFEFYVQARHAWNLRTMDGFARAEQLLNQAITLEPGFARAHAALGDVLVLTGTAARKLSAFGQRDSAYASTARTRIDHALALDPDLAEAHTSLGNLLLHQWQISDAIRELRRAVALNPNYATAHQWLARSLMADGRIEEAEAEIRRATELDPLSARIWDNYAVLLLWMDRPAEALAADERALALQPTSLQARAWKAIALSRLGRDDEAAALLRQTAWAGTFYESYAVGVLHHAGLKAEAEQAYGVLAAGASSNWRYLALAAMGRPTEALAAMDADTLIIDPWAEVLLSSAFDPIRRDPVFVKLLATLGMTEANDRAQAWRKAHPPGKPFPSPKATEDREVKK